LLAVCQVLARLRYNEPAFLAIFGGRQAMIESPLIKEIVAEAKAETKHNDILRVLRARLGPLPHDVDPLLRGVSDLQKLDELLDFAAQCPDLETFRAKLPT
jgi:hypothetical protein